MSLAYKMYRTHPVTKKAAQVAQFADLYDCANCLRHSEIGTVVKWNGRVIFRIRNHDNLVWCRGTYTDAMVVLMQQAKEMIITEKWQTRAVEAEKARAAYDTLVVGK